MSFFEELKCRSAFRAGNVYTVAAWLPIQVTDTEHPRIGLPGSAVTLAIALFDEQDGPSMARLHVAALTRESAPLLRSPAARVGTSMCQMKVKP